jgi:hypothetical protein
MAIVFSGGTTVTGGITVIVPPPVYITTLSAIKITTLDGNKLITL